MIIKGFKFLFKSIAVVAIFLVLVVFTVLMKPSILINETTAKWGLQFAQKQGIDLKYRDLDVSAKSESFSVKSFDFVLNGICADLTPAQGCFEKLHLSFAVDLAALPIKITRIGPIDILGGDLWVKRAQDKKEEPKKDQSSSSFAQWVDFSQMQVRPVTIDIPTWKVDLGKEGEKSAETLKGSFQLGSATQNSQLAAWKGLLSTLPSKLAQKAEINFYFENDKPDGLGKWKGKIGALARLEKKRGVDAKLEFAQKELNRLNFDYHLSGQAHERRKQVIADLKGIFKPDHFTTLANVTAKRTNPYAPKVRVQDCKISVQQVDRSEVTPGRVQVGCPILADLVLPGRPSIPRLKLPKSAQATFNADLRTAFPPDPAGQVTGTVGLVLDPILHPLFEGSGKVQAKLDGVPAQFPNDFKVESEMDLRVLMPSFQKVVKTLEYTKWAVPAPMNVMKGSLELKASGRGDLQDSSFPISFVTRLDSEHQKLNIDANGAVKLHKNDDSESKNPYIPHINMKVILSDVKLAMPRLSLEAPPKLIADRRVKDIPEKEIIGVILDQNNQPALQQRQKRQNRSVPVNSQAAGKAASEQSSLVYHIEIQTPESNPIRLVSNLTQAPVPIHVNIAMDSVAAEDPAASPMSGQIRVGDFPLKLFRRDASVEKFLVKFDEEKNVPVLDGSIRVSYTDYTIRILLFGTSSKPQVKLISDPPLPEDQLISVLLFGRSIGDLDESQGESVGNAQNALADGAVGLASLYLLASTPIESMGYDPTTGEVSAKVRLGEGTSLNVGAGDGTPQVGIRRRLSRKWTITTDFANRVGSNQSTVSAFLEWSSRY